MYAATNESKDLLSVVGVGESPPGVPQRITSYQSIVGTRRRQHRLRQVADVDRRDRQTDGRTDGQMDGRTPDRCVDPAMHSIRAVLINVIYSYVVIVVMGVASDVIDPASEVIDTLRMST